MSFRHTLATLMVNIVVNNKAVNPALNKTKGNVVNLAAKFYLLRAAIDLTIRAFGSFVSASNKVIDAQRKMETGFIDIERVAERLRNTGFRGDVLGLVGNLRSISIGEVQQLTENVARLGFTSRENILGVTEILAQMSQTSKIAANELVLDMGRIANVMDFKDEINSMERLGSTIVALAEASPTVESDIIKTTGRFAAPGKAIGMSPADILAMGTAARVVSNQTSTVVGTAMVRLMEALTTKFDEVVKAAHLSKRETMEFLYLFETAPADAIIKFLKLLGEMDAVSGAALFKELGISGFRAKPVFQAMSQVVGEFERLREVASDAANKNIELFSDWAARVDSLDSNLINLTNNWEILKTSVGNLDLTKSGMAGLAQLFKFTSSALGGSEVVSDPALESGGRSEADILLDIRKAKMEKIKAASGLDKLQETFTWLLTPGHFISQTLIQGKYIRATNRISELEEELVRAETSRKENAQNEITKQKEANLGMMKKFLQEETFGNIIPKTMAGAAKFASRGLGVGIQEMLPSFDESPEAIRKRRVGNIMRQLQSNSPTQFKGLTQAWKDAQGSTLKEDLEKQLIKLEAIRDIGFDQLKVQKRANEIMEDRLGSAIVR